MSTSTIAPPLQRIALPGAGPEDVVIDREGRLIAGLEDGRILRIGASGDVEMLVKTPGRPLGLEACADGTLLVCDSPTGLLRFDPATSKLETLVESAGGSRLIFCSNVVAARDGTLYFSASSSRYPFQQWRRDFVENVPSGRLFRRTTDGKVELLLDNLRFANGVVLAPDESWLVVAETAAQHVRRYWLSGPKAGTSDIFASTSGGYPDNMGFGSDGLVWVAIASPDNPQLAKIHALPMFARRLIARLPEALSPKPIKVGWLMAFDLDGTLVHDLRWSDGTYGMFTGVAERDGAAYVASLAENALLRTPVNTANGREAV
jgi:sugar lactone lactonase YvrE